MTTGEGGDALTEPSRWHLSVAYFRELRRQLGDVARRRLWPVGALLAALAITATMSDGANRYVADNRFEQYFNPARTLAKMFSVWDGSRGLGGPREDVWLGTTVPVALIRGLGFDPASAERLFHALCLVTLGLGVVALLRLFRPRIGPEHVLAGLLAMFGPFSASFLLPSNLFAMFALSPWLVVVFVCGVRSDRPWRWAAVFALLVLWAGNSDTPGLMYVAVMLVAVSVHLVVVERSVRWRDVVSWASKAIALSVGCTAWLLVKTYYANEPLNARLSATELPSASATSSSWSESFRGLGNWLSYFRDQGRLTKPQTAAYLEQPWIIAATFIPPIVALLVLWKSPWRTRLLFGAMALGGVVVMVGGFGVPNASPLGAATLWMFDNVTVLKSFRNTYKAGGGLVVGVSVLAAIGFVDGVHWCSLRSRWLPIVASVAGCVVMLGVAAPFVSASIYNPSEQVQSVPGYWTGALHYLNGLDDDGRSLIVPAISQAAYAWGYVGDDIFDALLARPHATATGWMLSTRTGHNALEAVTLAAQSPHYRPGVVAAMARRLGITEIVIRNDLDWARLHIARPATFRDLRSDATLELVRSFGRAGQGIIDSGEVSPNSDYERTLPPVEVYRLRAPGSYLDVVATSQDAKLVVSGTTESWPLLVQAGIADDTTEILSSGALTDSELSDALNAGASVDISDTARRRVLTLLHHEPQLSPTLSDGQELDRAVRPVYPDQPHAESVAWFRDAVSITGAFTRLGGNRNDQRASLAFDGDPYTAWTIPWSGIGPRPELTVALRVPTKVRRISIQSMMTATDQPTVKGVEVRFSDGSTLPIALDAHGSASVATDSQTTSSITIALTGIGVFGGEVGLTEVAIDNLDLVEQIQTPNDVFLRADPAVHLALLRTPVSYSFSRSAKPVSAIAAGTSSTAFDEEQSIHRRFMVAHDDSVVISGSLRLLASTSDAILTSLLGSELSASSDRPPGLRLEAPAAFALDGDPTTSWVSGAVLDSVLTLHLPDQLIHSISITEPADTGTARISRVETLVGGQRRTATFAATLCTRGKSPVCTRTAVVRLTQPVQASEVMLRITGIDDTSAYDPSLLRIAEVSVNSDPANSVAADRALSSACLDLGLRIGPAGAGGTSILVRVSGTMGDVLTGRPVTFQACAPLPIGTGTWQLETDPAGMFDQVALVAQLPSRVSTTSAAETTSSAPALTWTHTSAERIDALVTGNGSVTVTLRTSFDPQWVLNVAGRTLPARESNAGNSWTFDANGTTDVTIVYLPSERLRTALALSATSVLCCLVLAFRRRPTTLRPDYESGAVPGSLASTPSRFGDITTIVVATALSVALAGPWGLAIGALVLTLVLIDPLSKDVIGLVPPVLLAAAALSSAFTNAGAAVNIDYATRRLTPSTLAAFAVVFLFQSIGLAARDDRVASRHSTHSQPRGVRAWSSRVRLRASRLRQSWTHHRLIAILSIAPVAVATAALTPHLLDRSAIPSRLVSNLRLATSYSIFGPNRPVAISVRPLPVALVAFAPISHSWLAAGAAAACVVLAALLAMQWSRPRVAVLAAGCGGVAMAVLVVIDVRSLPSLLATAFATAGVLLASNRSGSSRTAACTGALLAGAVLCHPGAILVMPSVAYAWHRRGLAARWRVAALLIAALLACSWATFLADNGSSILFGWWHNPLQWAGGIAAAVVGLGTGMVCGIDETPLQPVVEVR